MRKKIIAVCLAVMLACLLWLVKDRWSLPAAQETEHEGLRVGLSQAEPLTPWKTAQIKSFKEAARRRGAQLIYHAPEEESLEWQIEDICLTIRQNAGAETEYPLHFIKQKPYHIWTGGTQT